MENHRALPLLRASFVIVFFMVNVLLGRPFSIPFSTLPGRYLASLFSLVAISCGAI